MLLLRIRQQWEWQEHMDFELLEEDDKEGAE
jgi:hypothetical protein